MEIITKTAKEKWNEELESFENNKSWLPFEENGELDDVYLAGFMSKNGTSFVFFLCESDYELSKITLEGKTESDILLANYLYLEVDDDWYDHAAVFDFIIAPDAREIPISLWQLIYHDVVKNGELKKESYDDDVTETENAEDYCKSTAKKIASLLRGRSIYDIMRFKMDGFTATQYMGTDNYPYIIANYENVQMRIQDSEYGVYIDTDFWLNTGTDLLNIELDDEDKELISIPSDYALTPEQRELVKKFEDLVSEMKKNEIGFILDYEADSKIRFVNMHETESIQSYYRRDEPDEDYTEKVGFGNLFDLKEDIFDAVTYSSDELLYAKPKK